MCGYLGVCTWENIVLWLDYLFLSWLFVSMFCSTRINLCLSSHKFMSRWWYLIILVLVCICTCKLMRLVRSYSLTTWRYDICTIPTMMTRLIYLLISFYDVAYRVGCSACMADYIYIDVYICIDVYIYWRNIVFPHLLSA